jgi:hypothetical protein
MFTAALFPEGGLLFLAGIAREFDSILRIGKA